MPFGSFTKPIYPFARFRRLYRTTPERLIAPCDIINQHGTEPPHCCADASTGHDLALDMLPPNIVHWQAFVEAFHQHGLGSFTRLSDVRDVASARLFCMTSKGFSGFEDTTVVPSLVKAASGVVLEMGPGAGNQIHRFDMSSVSRIYGIEPNDKYEDELNAKVEQHGLQGKYKVVLAGIDDSDVMRREGITEGSLDTVLCIQVLCAVKDPKAVMKEAWKLLKPGGKFIFWEHGWSRNHLTVAAQAILNPAWSTFIGCHLTRNVLDDILNAGEWENPGEIEEPEDPISLLPRIQGILIKKG